MSSWTGNLDKWTACSVVLRNHLTGHTLHCFSLCLHCIPSFLTAPEPFLVTFSTKPPPTYFTYRFSQRCGLFICWVSIISSISSLHSALYPNLYLLATLFHWCSPPLRYLHTLCSPSVGIMVTQPSKQHGLGYPLVRLVCRDPVPSLLIAIYLTVSSSSHLFLTSIDPLLLSWLLLILRIVLIHIHIQSCYTSVQLQ